MTRSLVLGASGFLGSHVCKQLVARGDKVRIYVRSTSNTEMIDHLPIQKFVGDLADAEEIGRAMDGCDEIYYCIVDTRAWLRDTRPLFEVNVAGLRKVLDIAIQHPIKRFVFTSSFVTIGHNPSGMSTEEDEFNWPETAPDYITCRVQAENLLLDYCQHKGLPGISCCVGNTYGEADFQPTPHGKLLIDIANKKIPFFWEGGGPSLNIKDAAAGLLLAGEKGKVGERYIFSESYVSFEQLFIFAARAAGVNPPKIKIPLPVLYGIGHIAELLCIILGRENKMGVDSIKCATILPKVSAEKAQRELAWQPGKVEDAVREAIQWYKRR